MSVFEALMMVSFGFAWPANIYKSYVSRSALGKSGLFIIIILVGYLCGITHKYLYSRDLVMVLYLINFVMISIDGVLFLRNRRLDRLRSQGKEV